MGNIRTKIGIISDNDINRSILSAKLIVLIATALKRGISIEDINSYSKTLADSYDIDDAFYKTCILCASKLVNSQNNFGRVIIKPNRLNIKNPQHFSNWILNGDDGIVRER